MFRKRKNNWLNYKPTVTGDAALFGDSITAPSAVAVDTPHIIGYLRFDNANAYTIGANGSSNLTLNNGTSNAVITVTSGSHTIAENVALLSNLDVIPATSTQLTMSGAITGLASRAVEVNGPGTLDLCIFPKRLFFMFLSSFCKIGVPPGREANF